MSAYCPASEVILRHIDEFVGKKIVFAGDLQDDLSGRLDITGVKAHCTHYHRWRTLERLLGTDAEFSLTPSSSLLSDCDTLIYYWPKSKQEAQFQLKAALSLLPKGVDIFVVGENRSGVRSVETLFADYGALHKIDSARRCGLYYGQLEKSPAFNLDEWWQSYQIDNLMIKTLPGVFSRDDLDVGSQLLLTALTQTDVRGNVLDIGCGAGVLATSLKVMFPEITITLADVSSAALASSKATLEVNGLSGEVIASDVFSDVQGRFDLIISNPPFHDGLQTSLSATEELIYQAKNHLKLGGKLCLVANAFLPYPDMLDRAFGNHEVLAQTGRFKVYQSVFENPAKKAKKNSKR